MTQLIIYDNFSTINYYYSTVAKFKKYIKSTRGMNTEIRFVNNISSSLGYYSYKVIEYSIIPIKNMYIYDNSNYIGISNKLELYKSMLKYNNSIYCCFQKSIVIFYNNKHNISHIYRIAYKYNTGVIPLPITTIKSYFNDSIGNILDIQRYLDFHERLDYIIDHS